MWKTFEEEDENGKADEKLSPSKLSSKHPLVLVMLTLTKTLERVEEKSKNSKLFLTLHLVQQLLLRGYRVRVAVSSSSPSNTVSKIKDTENIFLLLSGAEGFIEVVNIDEDFSTLDYSFSGDVVSVFLVSWKAVILEAATSDISIENKLIQRVEKVLYMCQNVNSVKKLVMTSCIAALMENYDASKVYSEADWNETSTIGTDPYAFRCVFELTKIRMTSSLKH